MQNETTKELYADNGAGIASLVMGIFSLVSVFFMAPLGIIFGAIGMVQSKRESGAMRGFARAGHITSKTGLILCVIITIIIIVAVVALGVALMFGAANLGDISQQMQEMQG